MQARKLLIMGGLTGGGNRNIFLCDDFSDEMRTTCAYGLFAYLVTDGCYNNGAGAGYRLVLSGR